MYVSVCARVSVRAYVVRASVCVCDIVPPLQHQTHILKVTNQDRWPFGKIKDTFLKKRHL